MMKASGRAALVVLAGLLLLFGASVQAAPSSASTKPDGASNQAEAVKPGKQRRHSSRRHTDSKTAQKSDDKTDKADKTDATPQADEAKASTEVPASRQMPPEVANANAQVAAADTPPAAAASAMTGRANDNVQAAADNSATPNSAAPNSENQVVAPDQLNDLDRALQQDNPPGQRAVVAATDAQPRPAPMMASSQPNSAWDQSSLIGKIFIGVGTLLTLASAARMFMA